MQFNPHILPRVTRISKYEIQNTTEDYESHVSIKRSFRSNWSLTRIRKR